MHRAIQTRIQSVRIYSEILLIIFWLYFGYILAVFWLYCWLLMQDVNSAQSCPPKLKPAAQPQLQPQTILCSLPV